MTRKTIPWSHIVVGYITVSPNQEAPAIRDHQKLFRDAFRHPPSEEANQPHPWSRPGQSELSEDIANAKEDIWVRALLQSEVEKLIPPSGNIDQIRPVVTKCLIEPDFRTILSAPANSSLTPRSGDFGTRCELRNGRWYNTRSYFMEVAGTQWPPDTSILGIITLTWPCPGPDNEGRPPTAEAARNRGADKPAASSRSKAKTKGRRSKP